MLWLYRILYPFALLVAAPFYLRRMWRRGGYREGFSQRFGRVSALPKKQKRKRIWLQAVSVGELLAVAPLLKAWASEDVEVYLSTTTSTGYALARERYAAQTIGIGYFPLDWWPLSARAWAAVKPDLALLMEGERWPEHIAQAARRGVPVVCVNARLSDRSFQRLRRVRWAVPQLLGGITRLLACSAEDAERFRQVGFAAERIVTTGNIKLDGDVVRLTASKRAALRAELGLPEETAQSNSVSVIVGASTWPGEEAALIAALKRARAAGHACSLLLVPRHAERRGEIEALLRESWLRFAFRSRGPYCGQTPVDVAVGDTTGELRNFLQLADVVFVGKSLPPHTEGQTPVESAILGKPILFGLGMGNFRAIVDDLVVCGAVRIVPDAAALEVEVVSLLSEDRKRAAMGAAGQTWHASNIGALKRTLAEIAQITQPS